MNAQLLYFPLRYYIHSNIHPTCLADKDHIIDAKSLADQYSKTHSLSIQFDIAD
jgi:hypothetical protein